MTSGFVVPSSVAVELPDATVHDCGLLPFSLQLAMSPAASAAVQETVCEPSPLTAGDALAFVPLTGSVSGAPPSTEHVSEARLASLAETWTVGSVLYQPFEPFGELGVNVTAAVGAVESTLNVLDACVEFPAWSVA